MISNADTISDVNCYRISMHILTPFWYFSEFRLKILWKNRTNLPLTFYIVMDILVNLNLCFLIFSSRFFTFIAEAAKLFLISKQERFSPKTAHFSRSFSKFSTPCKNLFSYTPFAFCDNHNWFSLLQKSSLKNVALFGKSNIYIFKSKINIKSIVHFPH